MEGEAAEHLFAMGSYRRTLPSQRGTAERTPKNQELEPCGHLCLPGLEHRAGGVEKGARPRHSAPGRAPPPPRMPRPRGDGYKRGGRTTPPSGIAAACRVPTVRSPALGSGASAVPEHGMDEPCERDSCSAAAGIKEGAGRDPWDAPLDLLEGGQMGNKSNVSFLQLFKNLNLERADGMQGDSSDVVRIVISLVYSVVCALGLVGNLLVLYLMKSKQGWRKSSINLFVTSLAVTDFQFVLTLPFWAVENALDFNWLFGKAMCKIVSYVTAMNMYASVFFLTAMSVARYRSVASALKNQGRGDPLGGCCSAKWLCAFIWLLAILASLPQAIFSTTATVFDDVLCLVKFPEGRGSNAQFWLGLYQTQKVLLGFVLPLAIISLCYLLLVRFISDKHVGSTCSGPGTKRRSKVTKSVSIVVLSFFLCWLPNQALTTWGILIKLNVVHFSAEYFLSQVYLFPISVCLAHSNSCLNPILYCLMRREFRKALKSLLWRITSPSLTTMRPFTDTTKPEQEEQALHALVPAHPVAPSSAAVAVQPELAYYPPGVVVYNSRCDMLPAASVEQQY